MHEAGTFRAQTSRCSVLPSCLPRQADVCLSWSSCKKSAGISGYCRQDRAENRNGRRLHFTLERSGYRIECLPVAGLQPGCLLGEEMSGSVSVSAMIRIVLHM